MTPTELTAYRDLCRRWPEAECPHVIAETSPDTLLLKRDHGPKHWVAEPHPCAVAALIHHLETAVLDRRAPGWKYESPYPKRGIAHEYALRNHFGSTPFYEDVSRLSALLAACEAVLTAKEPRP